MRDLERLQDAKTCEEQTISALKRISNRVNKSIDKIMQRCYNRGVKKIALRVVFLNG